MWAKIIPMILQLLGSRQEQKKPPTTLIPRRQQTPVSVGPQRQQSMDTGAIMNMLLQSLMSKGTASRNPSAGSTGVDLSSVFRNYQNKQSQNRNLWDYYGR